MRAVAGLDGWIGGSIVENEKRREQGQKSYPAHTDTARKSSTGYVERPANKSQVEISDLGGSGKKTTQNQAAEHLKIETAASQMV